MKNEGRALFLNAVCMKCLDGKDADRKLCCRFCATQWDGSSLIMGTMYAYDVFAAMPCCNERLKVCMVYTILYNAYAYYACFACMNDSRESLLCERALFPIYKHIFLTISARRMKTVRRARV